MKIVTGVIHAGKTTMLKASEKTYFAWDDWFSTYIKTEQCAQALQSIVPKDYLENAFVFRKLLAVYPDLLEKVCHATSEEFRKTASSSEFVEVPAYAVLAVRREEDTVIVITSPAYAELIERITSIRQCSVEHAGLIIAESYNQLYKIPCDFFVSDIKELDSLISEV